MYIGLPDTRRNSRNARRGSNDGEMNNE
jgi:hypothetical protein